MQRSSITEITVPTAIFPLQAVEIACHSVYELMEVAVVANAGEEATVRLTPLPDGPGPETAERIFRRELLIAAVNLRTRQDDLEIQHLAAHTADVVSRAMVRHIDDLRNPDSPNVPPADKPPALSQAGFPGTGYEVEWNREEGYARIRLHRLRFPLPVLLAAARHFRGRTRVSVKCPPGPVQVMTIQPRDHGSLDDCVSDLLQWTEQWALPAVPETQLGATQLDQPIAPELIRAAGRADHPARPGNGLPLTYFRTLYGRFEGVSLPYRLAEIFTMPLTSDTFLVSTRSRTWAILTRAEYRQLVEMRAQEDEDFFLILEALGIILTRRNLGDTLKLYALRYQCLLTAPRLFIMIPTNRCNMSCAYCHAEAGEASDFSKDMTEGTAMKAVDFFLTSPSAMLKPGGTLSIEFQGGECLLRWDLIKKVIDYADRKAAERQLHTKYTLCTNLIAMKDEILQEILQRGNIHLSSSLDGPADINDQQRVLNGGGGTHERVTGWGRKLRGEQRVLGGFLPTLTRNNLGHEQELVDEYRRQNCGSIYLRYVNQVGRAYTESYDTLGLTPEMYVDFWRRARDLIAGYSLRGEPITERKTASLMGNILTSQWSYMCLRRPCGMGLHQIVVDEHGNIFGCDQGRSNPMFALGNVATHTYDDCYTSDTSRLARTLISELYPKCRGCAFGAYCGYCVARGTRQHGTPQPKMPEDFECTIYRSMIPDLFRKLQDPLQAMVLNSWV